MERNKVVRLTTEYLTSLPDESNLTMREAVMKACPEAENDINDTALFDLLYEIEDSVRSKGVVLDFTAHDGLCEGLPFNLDFVVRKKRLQKVQIVSNLLCYGPCPEPEDAVEQRLTISATGRVWFTEYLYGGMGCDKYLLSKVQTDIRWKNLQKEELWIGEERD